MNFIKRITCVKFLVGLAVFSIVSASSLSFASESDSESVQQQFFTIDENHFESLEINQFQDYRFSAFPMDLMSDAFIQKAKSLAVSLLRWIMHDELLPQPSERYIRKLHFGRWINDPTDNTCMNTRAKVLVRDSTQDVGYRGNRQCVVDNGRWLDPYTQQEFETAKEIQIDHTVPLKNAYVSGAWQWDYKTRCLYANYMGYRNHLVPSKARENMSKGDRGPEGYLPPDLSYRCQYVKDWLTVKLIWSLNMNPAEVRAIQDVVVNYGCDPKDFRLTKKELEIQRETISENIEFCMQNKR